MNKRPGTSRFSTTDLLAVLAGGLILGAVLAGLGLGIGWLALQPPTPSAGTSTSAPPDTPTPIPTIPVQVIPPLTIAGGRLATTAGAVKFTLVTGAAVYVGPDSEVELTQLPAGGGQGNFTLFTLLKGRVLVAITHGAGDTVRVQSPSQDFAEISASVMGVEYDSATGILRVDCLEGPCRLGHLADGTPSDEIELSTGQSLYKTVGYPPSSAGDARFDYWYALGGDVMPTPTPSPTPDRQTLCATFQAQFPGTPCP